MTHPFSKAGATRQTVAAVIILIALALLSYANTFNVPFIYDDINNILANPHIRMTAVTPDSIAAVFNSRSAYRPLANLTTALNYYFHGYDVRGYHAVNLLVHLFTAWLMFLVARQTLRLCGTERSLVPLLAAALWLVNPVHTQSVTYTVQRMNSLAAMFYMLALFCYIRARMKAMTGQGPVQQIVLYALCLFSGLFGLFSKEIAVTLPVMLFFYEWFFFQNRNPAWLKKQLRWVGLSIAMFLLLAAIYLGSSPIDEILRAYQKHSFTLVQRLLTEPSVVIYYLCLLLFPHPGRLALIYNFPISLSPINPLTTLAGLLGITALVVGAIRLSGKQRLLSFAIFWFLGNLLIESSVFGLALAFEHRTYLPSIFPFIALTALWMKSRRTRLPAIAVLSALILVCGAWTHQRNKIWNDDIRFWRDNVAKTPEIPQVHNNLGQVLLSRGETGQAMACFRTAINQAPLLEAPRINLGVTLQRLGQFAPAIAQYQAVLAINSDNIEARYNLAMHLKEHGQVEAAIVQLKKIIAIDPNSTGAMLNLGGALLEQQKNSQALAWFEKAATIDSSDTRILNNLGIALHRLGRTDEAMAAYQQGLTINPRNPGLHNCLGLLLLDRGQYRQAARHFQLAIKADPELIDAYNNLGLSAERQGQTDQAIDYYQQALRLSPAYDLARYNLAALFLKTGRTDSALLLLRDLATVKLEHWPTLNRLVIALADTQELRQAAALAEKMAAAAPDDAVIYYNLACLYARQNDLEKAVACLKKAVALGYDRWEYMKTDPDLRNIYDTDYFKNLTRLQEM